ncbi:MAG: MCE family protein [Gemmatimonadales bacterium]|nr:MCE family protein [Gemmatimonadales bacterium]NIN12913.1 MCE family protein [Gemmatimonadales bacterium]NIR00200.1 MCE family protein [Gemmatimonadales bacterium]NIS65993.1 MCE family protein [Gemmatimonadales bacterium]
MDLYYKQEITVGVLVIAALAILISGLLWLTGRSFGAGGRVIVPVQFESVGGLTVGDPVQLSGVSVGRVADIRLDEVREGVWRVRVRLEVNRDVRPRVDAEARIRSLDFLGAKYVDYSPGKAPDLLPDDEELRGVGESDIASSAVALTEEATRTLVRTQDLLSEEMASQVHLTLAAAQRALDVVARVGEGPMVRNAASALTSLQLAAASLDSTLSNPAINESVSQLDEITESVKEMADGLAAVTTSLNLLLQQMRSPEGTVGMALTDSTLYYDLHETLQSLKLLLDDIRERPGRYINVTVF